jgi:hypothetical protein
MSVVQVGASPKKKTFKTRMPQKGTPPENGNPFNFKTKNP